MFWMKGWKEPGICNNLRIATLTLDFATLASGFFQQWIKSHALKRFIWVFSYMQPDLILTVYCLNFSQGRCHFQIIMQFFLIDQSQVQSKNSYCPLHRLWEKLSATVVKNFTFTGLLSFMELVTPQISR